MAQQQKSNFIGPSAKWPTILLFDSGVGGLSIYEKVQQLLPEAYYLYVFDNECFPYGEKAEQFIRDRVVSIVGTIWRLHKLDLIIIACNTASIISLSVLRQRFPVTIIGVVPAIKQAAKLTSNGRIGILATNLTMHSGYTSELIRKFARNCHILPLASSELVCLAEAKLLGEPVPLPRLHTILRKWLIAEIPPDTVVLGCTHFQFLKQELQAVLPKGTILVDYSAAIARRAAWIVQHHLYRNRNSNNRPSVLNQAAYYLTIPPEALKRSFRGYGFKLLVKLEL